MEYTRKLADFCAGVSLERLPDEVVDKAKLCVLDYVANVYGSLELDAVKNILGYVKSLGEGGTTCLGCGFSAPINEAVPPMLAPTR